MHADCVYCGCMSFSFSILIGTALLAGLVFGSFLNVCIVRLPAHRSIVAPPSHCQACGAHIGALDNIPLFSWIWLRGKCRTCHARISIQYPLVELGTALLWMACVLQTGATWQTLIDAAACFLLLGLAVMDAQTMLLPDTFTLTGIGVAFLLRVGAPAIESRGQTAIRTLGSAAIAAALLLLIWLLYWLVRRRNGLGMGDVKLMAMIGAFLGLQLVLFSYFVGVLAAALFAIVLRSEERRVGKECRL